MNQGHICKGIKTSRDPDVSSFSNSKAVWLELRKSIENHRKFRKMET
jgi:hypothetical protein